MPDTDTVPVPDDPAPPAAAEVITLQEAAAACGVTLQRVQRIVLPDASYGVHAITRKTKTGVREAQAFPLSEMPRLQVELTEREQKRKQSGAKRNDSIAVPETVSMTRLEAQLMEQRWQEAQERLREQSVSIAECLRTIEDLRADKTRLIAEVEAKRIAAQTSPGSPDANGDGLPGESVTPAPKKRGFWAALFNLD
ncbi:MAG: hypothetical protein V4671_30265 [Armatimonadota bacterium]